MPQKEITVKILISQYYPSNNEWLVCWFLSQLLFGSWYFLSSITLASGIYTTPNSRFLK